MRGFLGLALLLWALAGCAPGPVENHFRPS